MENVILNDGNTIWDVNTGQAVAVLEGTFSNGSDTIRNVDMGQLAAETEQLKFKDGDTVDIYGLEFDYVY